MIPISLSAHTATSIIRAVILAIAISFTTTAAYAIPTTIGLNFTAGSYGNDSTLCPPDTMGTVGPNHIIQLINGRYSVYDKSTSTQLDTKTLNNFWLDAGTTYDGSITFDPRVMYDPSSRRYFATSVDNARGNNNILLAVSRSSNPLDGWSAFKIDSDTNNQRWADFPMLGINNDYITVAATMFAQTGQSASTDSSILAVPKADLLLPTPTIINRTFIEDVRTKAGYTPQATLDLDNTTTSPTFFGGYGSSLWRSSIIDLTSSPSIIRDAVISIPYMSVAPDGEQPGPKQNLDNTDARISSNLVTQQGTIWGTQTRKDPITNNSAIRWFKIDEQTNTLLEEGVISDPDLDLMYPSIAVNELGHIVIGFTGTSEDLFASSFAVIGQTNNDITTFDDEFLLLKQGLDDYERIKSGDTRNRWGDYSATVLDPLNSSHFWTFQEFVLEEDIWAVQITQIIIPEPISLNILALSTIAILIRRRQHV